VFYDSLPYLLSNAYKVLNLPSDEPFIDLKGRKVLVLGGGDTAMDCVRTAVRQQAAQVTCAYRRDESNMPGSHREVKNAREEGVKFKFNLQPTKIQIDKQGQVTGVEMVKTALGEADEQGRRRPEPVKGSEHVLAADAVIMAFGFLPHKMDWLAPFNVNFDNKGKVITSANQGFQFQTSNEKIFAGGDAVRGSDLVVTAIDDGRKAAEGMLDYLEV